MAKKRIGVFLNVLPYVGGTFQYCQTIIDALAKFPRDQYEIVVAYSYPTWGEFLAPYPFTTHQLKIRLLDKVYRRGWYWSGLPLSWWRSVSRYFLSDIQQMIALKADLWIFPSQDAFTYQSSSINALGVIHDLMHRYERRFPEVSAKGEYQRREYLYKGMVQFSRAVLVDSDYGKQQVLESYGGDPEKIYPLPYIAPKYIFSDQEEDLQEYRLPARFLFYPAQFWLHKNHLNLVKALKQVKEEIPDISLVLAGSTKYHYKVIEQEVAEAGLSANVHFLGYVPNEKIPALYRQARALIMPTFFGPTNIPPLEAFYLGCPVAVSDIYGIPEQVGEAALLFDPLSVDAMVAVIKALWTDDALCRRLVEQGQAHYQNWNLVHFTERLKQIIDQVMD